MFVDDLFKTSTKFKFSLEKFIVMFHKLLQVYNFVSYPFFKRLAASIAWIFLCVPFQDSL